MPDQTPLPMSFRAKPATKAALERAAGDDARSVSSLIEKILADWLRTHGFLAIDAQKPVGPATDVVEAMDRAIKTHRGSKALVSSRLKKL